MTPCRSLPIALVLVLLGCSKEPSGPNPSARTEPALAEPTLVEVSEVPLPSAERLVCTFAWSEDRASEISITERVEVDTDAKAMRVGDFDVRITRSPSDLGGRVLEIEVGDSGASATGRFDFGAHQSPAHLPAGAHGFTGLRYQSHPTERSRMQYHCGAYAADVDVTDEQAAQSAPGPSVATSERISCAVTAFDASGSQTGRDAFVLDSGGKHRKLLGDFSFAVDHALARREAGGITTDVSVIRGVAPSVHTLYQLRHPLLPANILAGPSFTGVQKLSTADGERLEYACRVGT